MSHLQLFFTSHLWQWHSHSHHSHSHSVFTAMRTCSKGARCISNANPLTVDNFQNASSGPRSSIQFQAVFNEFHTRMYWVSGLTGVYGHHVDSFKLGRVYSLESLFVYQFNAETSFGHTLTAACVWRYPVTHTFELHAFWALPERSTVSGWSICTSKCTPNVNRVSYDGIT